MGQNDFNRRDFWKLRGHLVHQVEKFFIEQIDNIVNVFTNGECKYAIMELKNDKLIDSV